VAVVLLGWFFMDVNNIGVAIFAACTFTFLGVQAVEVFAHINIYLYIYLFIYSFIYLLIYLFIYLFIC
jgi:hypothetical protein